MSFDNLEFLQEGPLDLKDANETQIKLLFSRVYQDILSFINDRPDEYPTKKPLSRKLLLTQARAIAAVRTCKTYAVFKKVLARCYKVTASTFCKYRKMAIEEEMSYQEMFSPEGRPLMYHPLIDEKFMEWLTNDNTATIEKNLSNTVDMYRKLYCQAYGSEEESLFVEGRN